MHDPNTNDILFKEKMWQWKSIQLVKLESAKDSKT